MNDCNAVVLLSLAVFFGCIAIGFVLAAASLPANDDYNKNEPPGIDGSLKE